jgi:hypothetical protein
MTTPAGCDIPALHATIASSSALHEQRRTLYQLAADLLEVDGPRVLQRDIIDSPLTRQQIGDALAGRSRLSCSGLVAVSALAAADAPAHGLQVVARPEANTLLADALAEVGAELARQRAPFTRPRLLTKIDGSRFTAALAALHDGIALARVISPELVEDLLTHVALVGMLDPHRAGGLSSGSSRTFPGLVLLGSGRSSIDVAEALVHEGAHQKLFDLGITHDLLTIDSERCAPFHPPWTPADRFWSLETTLAACHAYACLARFSQDAGVPAGMRMVGPGSLLPVANDRSEIIGQWLLDNGGYLGNDAHTLLAGLFGRRPRIAPTGDIPSVAVAADYVIDDELVFRRCSSSDRVLVARPSLPPQLYWISADAAALLEFLRHKPFEEVIDTFTQRWKVPRWEVSERLTRLLSCLSASGLVTISL